MNEAHRNLLQRHLRQLANDIILTDDLTAALFQHRIFERNMIELIKSEKTATDQVYKMLELLPKRGPDAFDTFVQIIENDYPWLAAMLASTEKQETRPSRMDSYKSESGTYIQRSI
ncbi:hypothetical protein KUTeg_000568 [Tegillarca granosa]|uniref:CARD domain-containing protein n=1 Tax=Tegillarca granosa TaxID=220873 RepID=A0ABQ9FYZ0_TEGGR|nr:hypothetical protein KUTeg_000568 [Tegillarca granosa]